MQVETYEVEELTGEASNMAADSEASELIASLGLGGQRRLLNPDTVTRQPYRLITKEENAVFTTLFPNQSKLCDYADGIIPLRVLQLVAHAKESGFFNKGFYVWHPEPGKSDPVLVGHVERPVQTWTTTDTYLLARWGDALLPFEDLRKKAAAVLVSKWKVALAQVQQQVKFCADNLELCAESMVQGNEQRTVPHFYF